MKRFLIVCGVLLGVFLIAALVGFYYVNSRYGLTRAPRITYSQVEGDHFPIRVEMQPLKAKDDFLNLLEQSGAKVPSYALDRVLPQEVTILASINPTLPQMDLHVFVNEQSFGPVIQQMLNQNLKANPPSRVVWSTQGVQFPRRGVLTLDGNVPVPSSILDAMTMEWGSAHKRVPLKMDGNHFIEAVIDNRDGAAYTLVLLLTNQEPPKANANQGNQGQNPAQAMQQAQLSFLTNSLKQTESVHLIGEPGPADVLDLTVTFTCTKESGRAGPETVKTVLDTGLTQGAPVLESVYGLNLAGESQIKGQTVVGTYKLSPFSKLLDMFTAPKPQAVPAKKG